MMTFTMTMTLTTRAFIHLCQVVVGIWSGRVTNDAGGKKVFSNLEEGCGGEGVGGLGITGIDNRSTTIDLRFRKCNHEIYIYYALRPSWILMPMPHHHPPCRDSNRVTNRESQTYYVTPYPGPFYTPFLSWHSCAGVLSYFFCNLILFSLQPL